MSWAAQEADKIASAERQLSDERTWILHCKEIVGREGPLFFAALSGQMEAYVREFNEHLSSNIEVEKAEGMIAITKQAYPTRHVRLTLTDAGVGIYTRSMESYGRVTDDRRDTMRFAVERDGETVTLDGSNHEALARRILSSVFAAFSPRR
jgi:hypothetical protein